MNKIKGITSGTYLEKKIRNKSNKKHSKDEIFKNGKTFENNV